MSVVTPERIGSYVFKGDIGQGSFAVVKIVMHVPTSQLFACKVIRKAKLVTEALITHFENEIRIIQQLRHPGIVQLYDLLQDEHNYYLIMELCQNGELFQYIVDNQRLPELEAKYFLKQVFEALEYVHNLGIVHRDLKPENLLLTQDGKVKITDFGLSKFVNQAGLADTPCGSPCYASPEIILGGNYNGRKSDLWSVGVIAYAMVTGELPWTKLNQTQLFDQIKKGDYQIPGYVSEGCKNLIRGLMEPDPEKRFNIEQAMKHPWLCSAPPHRFKSEGRFGLSLKTLDKFFGRDTSEIKINETDMMRSCSVLGDNFENTARKIQARPQRQTARVAAQNILYRRKSLQEYTDPRTSWGQAKPSFESVS